MEGWSSAGVLRDRDGTSRPTRHRLPAPCRPGSGPRSNKKARHTGLMRPGRSYPRRLPTSPDIGPKTCGGSAAAFYSRRFSLSFVPARGRSRKTGKQEGRNPEGSRPLVGADRGLPAVMGQALDAPVRQAFAVEVAEALRVVAALAVRCGVGAARGHQRKRGRHEQREQRPGPGPPDPLAHHRHLAVTSSSLALFDTNMMPRRAVDVLFSKEDIRLAGLGYRSASGFLPDRIVTARLASTATVGFMTAVWKEP